MAGREQHRTTEHQLHTAVDALAKASETEEFESHSSLRLFTELQHSYADGMPLYLDDRHNLAGTRLLTKV